MLLKPIHVVENMVLKGENVVEKMRFNIRITPSKPSRFIRKEGHALAGLGPSQYIYRIYVEMYLALGSASRPHPGGFATERPFYLCQVRHVEIE